MSQPLFQPALSDLSPGFQRHEACTSTVGPNSTVQHERRKLRILIVDDNLLNLRVMKQILTEKMRRWIDVQDLSSASSGPDALSQFGREIIEEVGSFDQLSPFDRIPAFDLVFLDISMPGMSGIEVAQRLRLKFGSPQLHICAVTTDLEDWQVQMYRHAGMDGVIGKPLKIEDLEFSLGKCLESLNQHQPPLFYFRRSGSCQALPIHSISTQGIGLEWTQAKIISSPRKISVVSDNLDEYRPKLDRLDSLDSATSSQTTHTFNSEPSTSHPQLFESYPFSNLIQPASLPPSVSFCPSLIHESMPSSNLSPRRTRSLSMVSSPPNLPLRNSTPVRPSWQLLELNTVSRQSILDHGILLDQVMSRSGCSKPAISSSPLL